MVATRSPVSVPGGQVGVQEKVSVSVSVAVEVTENGALMGLPVISANAERTPVDAAPAPEKIPSPFGQGNGPIGLGFTTETLAEVVDDWLVFPQFVLDTTLAKTVFAIAGTAPATTSPQMKRTDFLRRLESIWR
jgi:hypothetical protein